MKVISTEKHPIKVWAEDIEQGAEQQLKNLANLPFIHQWVCAMPDCHQGYGMPIGGVIATKGVVIPNAVGVDIGCGMCAIKTSLTDISDEKLKEVLGCARKCIPVGFKHLEWPQDDSLMPELKDNMPIVDEQYEKALFQLGTLGGGNHFIEIQKGSDGNIWIMIHSGSRNLGKMVADHYNKKAVELNELWHTSIPKAWELAFLPADSELAVAYLNEMQFCVDFALANRKLMMEIVIRILEQMNLIPAQEAESYGNNMINIAHNYAQLENHMGKNVYVHRKGATRARPGEIGIIPGSMGTSSYIVEGLGNFQSFMSCSHGAGRRMGRKEAIKTLNLAEEQAKMKGIIGAPRTQDELEEAPGAYKNIEDVMKQQKDLVKINVSLSPLAVIKG
jgi:tRNA-splicing ligase RtcB (3'-phosphate/5'-hydroxy nucleic acid ligase)